MLIPIWFWIFVSLVILQRLSELLISKRNTTWIKTQGGREFGKEQMKWVVALMIFFFFALAVEAYFFQKTLSPLWKTLFLFFILAQALRYWTMLSLGKFWNVRIWIVPNFSRVTRGPYRYFSHPNYLAVLIELICLPLMVECWITALSTSLGFLFFLSKRIPAEEKALSLLKK